MKIIRDMKVYDNDSRDMMNNDTKPDVHVGTRWFYKKIDGGGLKARLVAKEFAGKGDTGNELGELFSATPGLHSLRMLMSNLASGGLKKGHGMVIGGFNVRFCTPPRGAGCTSTFPAAGSASCGRRCTGAETVPRSGRTRWQAPWRGLA